ncbi:SE1832 family protein [Aeribacillus sp. FSL W8-0870]|uniref:SE1832 family protein n=1 Tax=Aeribacillus sp. FSL W8-0870 TaxID=2954706 RepID=UPI0030CE3143
MTKQEIEQRIAELKSDYIRIQGDIEKLESVGGNIEKAEQQLTEIENELASLRTALNKQR